MKKFIFFSAIVFFAITVNGQKVALHAASGVQFFNGTAGFLNAYNAASAGDTIYLPGGGFTSPGTINKKMMIYGAGHYPDSTSATSKTIILGSINLTGDADGFRIEGADFTGGLTTTTNEAVDNILIKYCRFQGGLNIQGDLITNLSLNLTIINCVVQGSLTLTNAQNAGVYNSIFHGEIQYTYGNNFQNNIFMLNNRSNTIYKYTIIGDNNTLENNIFLRTMDREIAGNTNTLKNNVTPRTPFWGTNPIEGSNYINVPVDAIFVNQTGNVFDYTHNYHLQSPLTYIGEYGTEVGLYGGTFGYKEGAVPSNPHFSKKNIAATTDADGLLHIEINAAAQDK